MKREPGGSRGGNLLALGASLVALGVALACAWRLIEAGAEEPARAGSGERGDLPARIGELAQQIDELEQRLADVERWPAPAAGRDAELAAEREELPIGEDAGAAIERASDELDPVDARREAESARARVRRLARVTDPVERLALAREMIGSQNPLEQVAAVRLLAELAPAEAFAVVDQWLVEVKAGTRGDWFVVDAARALEQQGDPRCMEAYLASLAPKLAASDVGERSRAVFKLGASRSATVTPLVLPHLRDASAEVRLAALDALRTSGDASAIAALAPLLDDPVAAVRDRAARTLETLRRRDERSTGPGAGDRPGDAPRPREGLRDLLRRPRR